MKLIHKIRIFSLLIFSCSTAFPQDSISSYIDQLAGKHFKNNMPGGVILASKEGKIVYQKAFGMASMELEVPMKEDMLLYIGSNTKQFTAVAILQLLEKGRLSLNDSIGKYVPCTSKACSITIRQLLSHTSGLGNKKDSTVARTANIEGKDKSHLTLQYTRSPIDAEPGSKWAYHNGNYYVLAYILEKITGKSYEEYLTENIFKPAGMMSSYVANETSVIKNKASGYVQTRNGLNTGFMKDINALYSSGGILSTAEDLFKWNQALKSNILLKKETLQMAFTKQKLNDGTPVNYGFGWHLENLRGSRTYRHGGAVVGFISETLYLPDEDIFVTMLLNSEGPVPAVALTRVIASQYTKNPYQFNKIAINPTSLRLHPGLYQNQKRELINITASENQLYFQRPGGIRYALNPASVHHFFLDINYLWIEFHTNALSQTESLSFSQVGVGETSWSKTNKQTLKLYPDRLPDSLLNQYEGIYITEENDSVLIKKEGIVLTAKMAGKTPVKIYPQTQDLFFSTEEDLRIEFQKTQDQIQIINRNIKKSAVKQQ
jgi:CubicO group peptidase (beta-lactamase class C family)